MIIRNQKGTGFVVIGKGIGVEIRHRTAIHCIGIQDEDGFDMFLGRYNSPENAKLVIDEIYDCLIDCQNYDMPDADILERKIEEEHRTRYASQEYWEKQKKISRTIENKSSDLYEKLSSRTANALVRAGYFSISDVSTASTKDLHKVRHLGDKSFKELKALGLF